MFFSRRRRFRIEAREVRATCETLEHRRLLSSSSFHRDASPGLPSYVEFDLDTASAAGLTVSLKNQLTDTAIPVAPRIGTWDGGTKAAVFIDLPNSPDNGDYYAKLIDSGTTILTNDFRILSGDLNEDGVVRSEDFSQLALNFNSSGAVASDGDQNGDGVVNALDFNSLASDFGQHTAITPRFDAGEFDTSDDASSIFDINDPATFTFTRNITDRDGTGQIDTSQDYNIYYTFPQDLDPAVDAIPERDFDPGVPAPANSDIYVFTIPAGQMSATLSLATLDSQYRYFHKGISLSIIDQNSG
jgi:hypothetical protein